MAAATRELRKHSTPANSSSQQSPMQASVSSYLKFQRFSRELGASPKQTPTSGFQKIMI